MTNRSNARTNFVSIEINKKIFKIACTWSMYGTLHIEAKSLEEAKQIAIEEQELPSWDAEYLEDSFEINDHMTKYFLNEGEN